MEILFLSIEEISSAGTLNIDADKDDAVDEDVVALSWSTLAASSISDRFDSNNFALSVYASSERSSAANIGSASILGAEGIVDSCGDEGADDDPHVKDEVDCAEDLDEVKGILAGEAVVSTPACCPCISVTATIRTEAVELNAYACALLFASFNVVR